MSCLENDILYENTCEAFFEALDNDYDFHNFIYEHFLDHQEQYIEAKITCRLDEDAYGRAFEDLWNWDIEGMCENFKKTAQRYVNQQQEIQECYKEWKQQKQKNNGTY